MTGFTIDLCTNGDGKDECLCFVLSRCKRKECEDPCFICGICREISCSGRKSIHAVICSMSLSFFVDHASYSFFLI